LVGSGRGRGGGKSVGPNNLKKCMKLTKSWNFQSAGRGALRKKNPFPGGGMNIFCNDTLKRLDQTKTKSKEFKVSSTVINSIIISKWAASDSRVRKYVRVGIICLSNGQKLKLTGMTI